MNLKLIFKRNINIILIILILILILVLVYNKQNKENFWKNPNNNPAFNLPESVTIDNTTALYKFNGQCLRKKPGPKTIVLDIGKKGQRTELMNKCLKGCIDAKKKNPKIKGMAFSPTRPDCQCEIEDSTSCKRYLTRNGDDHVRYDFITTPPKNNPPKNNPAFNLPESVTLDNTIALYKFNGQCIRKKPGPKTIVLDIGKKGQRTELMNKCLKGCIDAKKKNPKIKGMAFSPTRPDCQCEIEDSTSCKRYLTRNGDDHVRYDFITTGRGVTTTTGGTTPSPPTTKKTGGNPQEKPMFGGLWVPHKFDKGTGAEIKDARKNKKNRHYVPKTINCKSPYTQINTINECQKASEDLIDTQTLVKVVSNNKEEPGCYLHDDQLLFNEHNNNYLNSPSFVKTTQRICKKKPKCDPGYYEDRGVCRPSFKIKINTCPQLDEGSTDANIRNEREKKYLEQLKDCANNFKNNKLLGGMTNVDKCPDKVMNYDWECSTLKVDEKNKAKEIIELLTP